jgi:hypothetical protein
VGGARGGVGVVHAEPGLPACDPKSIAGRTPETPTRIVVGRGPTGPEMTVSYRGGRYVVSRCDDDGRLVEAQDVQLFEGPDPGEKHHLPSTATEPVGEPGKIYKTTNADFAVDPRKRLLVPGKGMSKAEFRSLIKRSRVLPPTQEGTVVEPTPAAILKPLPLTTTRKRSRLKARASYFDQGCNNYSFAHRGEHWPQEGFPYWVNLGSVPDWGWLGASGGPPVDNAIERGINEWNFYSEAECNPNGSTSVHRVRRVFNIWRAGWTTQVWSWQDWVNTLDFGPIGWCGPSYGPAACTIRWTDWSVSQILEADIRFANNWPWKPSTWADNCCGDKLLVRMVATHEFGHALGLDHAGNWTWQTMQPELGWGLNELTNLGAGDECGFFNLYYGNTRCATSYF